MKYFSLKKFRNAILFADTPPKVTAVSFGLGVGIAFSPFVGMHIFTALVLSKIWKLNAPVIVSATLISNPWTALPVHLFCLAVGDLVMYGGFESFEVFRQFPIQELNLWNVFDGEFWGVNGPKLLVVIKPFLVGSFLVSLIAGLTGYKLISLVLLKRSGVENTT